jgi:hypothetical protein
MNDVDAIVAAVEGVSAEAPGRQNRDVLMDFDLPAMVRGFIALNQGPATETMAIREAGFMPRLYATYREKRVRVTMVSRLGDVGISHKDEEYGYFTRCSIYDLTDFADEMFPTAPARRVQLRQFTIVDRHGFWARVVKAEGVPLKIVRAEAPVLFTTQSKASRVRYRADPYGLERIEVIPVLITKVGN